MLRIKGGKVYDPANNINGVVQDICMDNGKIVADVDGCRRRGTRQRLLKLPASYTMRLLISI